MIFSENNLYGWGTIDVSMPRATFEPHPDRLRRTGKVIDHDRRGGWPYRWHPSSTSRILLDDYPWNQAFLLCIFSSLIMAYICLLHSTLPEDHNQQLTNPVEIVVAMHKDEPQAAAVSVEQEPLAAIQPEPMKETVTFESVIEEPPKNVIDKPKEVKQKVAEKIPEIAPEPPLPPVKIKQKDVPKKAKEPQRMASVMPMVEEQKKPKKVTISPPIHRKRNYAKKDQNTISQAHQASKVANFISAKDKRLTEDIVDISTYKDKKSYYIQKNKKLGDPQLKTTANLVALNQSNKTMEPASWKTKSAKQRYGNRANILPSAARSAPPSTNQQLLFASQRREKIPGLEPKNLYSQFNKPSTASPSVSKRTKQTSVSKKQGLSFQSKKLKENPTLPPLASNKSLPHANRPAAKSAKSLTKVHNFPEKRALGEIEPIDLIKYLYTFIRILLS